MKKILFICAVALLLLQGCYDEYKTDYEFTTTYFSLQKPFRTLLIEEGKDLSMEVGVVLSGKYVNNVNEVVGFEMPSSLLDGTGLELLPSSYYDISSTDEFVIKSGSILGTVKITLNDNFLNDPLANTLHYALPFQITSSSADSILAGKDYTIVAIRYQNMYYGSYWIKGADVTLDESDMPVDTFVYSNKDLSKNLYTIFSTSAQDTSIVNFVGADKSGNNKMKLGIKADGSIEVKSSATSDISNITGSGNYDKENRIFTLNYTYMKGAVKHSVKDTLYHFDTPMSLVTW